jgi:hypothetical protein
LVLPERVIGPEIKARQRQNTGSILRRRNAEIGFEDRSGGANLVVTGH